MPFFPPGFSFKQEKSPRNLPRITPLKLTPNHPLIIPKSPPESSRERIEVQRDCCNILLSMNYKVWNIEYEVFNILYI